MKYSDNEERSSRLEKFGKLALGGTFAALAIKESGGLKYISKALGDIGKTASKISNDLSEKAFRDIDYATISKTVKNNILDDDSTWKMARRTTNEIELDYSRGLFPSILQYEKIKKNGSYLKDEMFDSIQKNEIVTSLSKRLENESGEFFSELTKLVDESLNRKSVFFESDNEGIKLIREEFDNRINGSILENKKDDIYSVFQEAINNAEDLRNDFYDDYENNLKNKIANTFKDEIIEKYSSKNNNDFFKDTLDRAATVGDLLREVHDDNLNIANKELYELSGNTTIIDYLDNLVKEDSSFNDLVIDNKTLRIDKDGKLYSTKSLNDLKEFVKEETADTIPGKLVYARSFTDIKKAPDFFYLPKGSYDAVLSDLTGSKNGLLSHESFRLGNRFYQYMDGQLVPIKDSENLYLMSGRHGALNVINNRLQGNFSYKGQENSFLKFFDINTTGDTVVNDVKGFFGKFNKDSDWIKNSKNRLFDKSTYENINEESINTFTNDIRKINKLYNQRLTAPSKKSINELKKVLSPTSSMMLEALDSDKPVEYLLSKGFDKFQNADLTSLLNKYKSNISSIKNMAQIGDLGGKSGMNILKYDDLIKREIVKESLLRDITTSGKGNSIIGSSITYSKLSKMNLSNSEIKNIKNIFNWGVLQKETDSFSSSLNKMNNKEHKIAVMSKFGELIERSSTNEQIGRFMNDFRSGLNSFINSNASAFEIIKETNNSVTKGYKNNEWVAMRKSVNPLDIIKGLNDNEKTKANVKAFAKQFAAGRNNTKDITTATFLPYHMLNRLVTPLEKFGLGFSKDNTSSTFDLAKNIMLKRVLPVIGIGYAFSYLNFEAENITGTSFTQDFQNFKANVGVGVKTAQEMFGLSNSLRRSRMYNPITNYWLGEYKDKDEYLDYLENGYDPIRKGRWWNFGSASEFRGGKISYWEPNKLRQAYSHYKDVSLYGSENEKWKHSWIPTPRHPLSPIRNLLDPYWLERKHYWDRPYPVTGKLFAEETPWGAILNPTLGEIIKPQRRMHQRELGNTLVDVRTLIANRNKEIKEKATENRIVRIDQGGFTPMEYSPESMPSTNEAVYTINVDGRGNISSSGFEGQDYADSLDELTGDVVPRYNYGTELDNVSKTIINKLDKDYNSNFISNLFMSGITSVIAGGSVSANTSLSLIASMNNGIKARSNEQGRNGVIIEKARLHTNPYSVINAKDKTLNTTDVKAIGTKQEYISDLIYSGKQLSGMYGFIFDTILPPSHGYKLEHAGRMNSFVSSFWDQSLGGWGGDFMEIARRFFPHENHDIEQINPIRNTMPTWLPERYQTGDPYTKVTKGEARLPGDGYETLNKLHPDKYGRYGAFDRYKILADVSPGSDEYKVWKKIAKEQIVDPKLKKEMEQIEKRVKAQSSEHSFYNYKFLGKQLETHTAVIEKVSNTGKIKIVGSDEQYQLAGVKPLTDPNKQSYIHEYLKPGMIVEMQWEKNKYRNRLATGEISALVNIDGESVAKKMWEQGKAKEKDNKETLADELFAASSVNKFFGPLFEAVGHAQIPYIHNKYLRIDSPYESYEKEQVYGTSYSTWDHPIKGFIQPTFQYAWSRGPINQIVGVGTWYLSNKAIKEGWEGLSKYGAHALFAFTNPGGLAGGIIGAIPTMNFGNHKSKIWNTRNFANIGAAAGLIGYGFANLNNPILSAGNFATAGSIIANQLKYTTKEGKLIGGKEGAVIGAAVGLGLSAMKNPSLNLKQFTEKYIPKDTEKKWEIEEYFDRLEYLKYTNLYNRAARQAKRKEGVDVRKIINQYEYNKDKNKRAIARLEKQKEKAQKHLSNDSVRQELISNIDYQIYNLQVPDQYFKLGEYSKAAIAYKKAADTTIYGLTEDSSSADILRALPKYDRDYFLEFAKEKDPEERKKILKIVSPYKQKALKLMWGEKTEKQQSNSSYFSHHNLPNLFWSGWRPDINLDNVKVKTIENEGMLLSDFGIYDSQKNEPEVVNAPAINNINSASSPLALQRDLIGLLNGVGLQHVDVSVETTSAPGIQFITNIGRITEYNIKEKVQNVLYNIF